MVWCGVVGWGVEWSGVEWREVAWRGIGWSGRGVAPCVEGRTILGNVGWVDIYLGTLGWFDKIGRQPTLSTYRRLSAILLGCVRPQLQLLAS